MSLCRHESEVFMTQIYRLDYAMRNHEESYIIVACDFWNGGVSTVTVWLRSKRLIVVLFICII